MQVKRVIGWTFVAAIALAGGVQLGMMGAGLAQAASPSRPSPGKPFAVNAKGQTYGSDFGSTSMATEPDLILAQGTDGTIGYVRKSDLFGVMPRTPQQALAEQGTNSVDTPRTIPLYASDGTTIIGKFIVGGGHIQVFQPQKPTPSAP